MKIKQKKTKFSTTSRKIVLSPPFLKHSWDSPLSVKFFLRKGGGQNWKSPSPPLNKGGGSHYDHTSPSLFLEYIGMEETSYYFCYMLVKFICIRIPGHKRCKLSNVSLIWYIHVFMFFHFFYKIVKSSAAISYIVRLGHLAFKNLNLDF